ncbi:MAG: hypothetical protein N2509_00865 [Treponemataceae bacterium]|nr:hypothetical protein [Treponemataceae bacterium]
MYITCWQLYYQLGKRHIRRHHYKEAIYFFRRAIDACPAQEINKVGPCFFWLGMALDRIGRHQLAVKSWVQARRLVKTGYIARLYDRWVNGYGRRKQKNPDLDDYDAFRAIQIEKYLRKRGNGRFCSAAERDVVYAIIDDTWRLLSKKRIFSRLSVEEKLELFKRARLDFPFLYLEDALTPEREPNLARFSRGASPSYRLHYDDPCPCGSGLPARMCCYRIVSKGYDF